MIKFRKDSKMEVLEDTLKEHPQLKLSYESSGDELISIDINVEGLDIADINKIKALIISTFPELTEVQSTS